jgi:hypothetical protein
MRYAKLRGARSAEKQRFATVCNGAIPREPDCITAVKSQNEAECFLPISRGPIPVEAFHQQARTK